MQEYRLMQNADLMKFASRILMAALLTASAVAQQVIGVRAGLISHAQGWVFLDEAQLYVAGDRSSESPTYEVKDGSTLRTSLGRVEIQLGAGAVLRMNRRGILRMVDSRLTDMQLQLEYGSVMVEIFEAVKDNKISLIWRSTRVEFKGTGLYRLDSDASKLRVYGGKAEVYRDGKKKTVKGGKAADLISLSISKFEAKPADRFHKWAARRSFDHFNMNQQSRRRLTHWTPLFGGWMHSRNYDVRMYSPTGYADTVSGYSRTNGNQMERQRRQVLELWMREEEIRRQQQVEPNRR